MSISIRLECRRPWRLPFVIACLSLPVGIAPSAPADELVVRPNLHHDRKIYSFDEDGVRFGPGIRPIGWDDIVSGTVATGQASFDRLRQELGGPLYEMRSGLENGKYLPLLESAESLFPRFAERHSNSAYLVAQTLMWARLAAHRPEDAIEPYFVCVTLRLTLKDLSALPGPRHLKYDSHTGQSPALPLAGFDRGRAKAALPLAQARLRRLGNGSPPGLRLYIAGLALAANEPSIAEAELTAFPSPTRPVSEIVDALRAHATFLRGKKSQAISSLERLHKECLPSNRCLVDYLCGTARLEAGIGNRADGVIDLLNVAALHGEDQPALAAAALYSAQKALREQHDDGSARAVQIELLRAFPESDHGARLLAELGPESAVTKAAAEAIAAAAEAKSEAPSDADDRGPSQSRAGQPAVRKRAATPKAKEKSR